MKIDDYQEMGKEVFNKNEYHIIVIA